MPLGLMTQDNYFDMLVYSMSFCFNASEHSRHWFFKGRMVINGEELPDSLFSLIMSTQQHSNDNNVIKFNDNSRYRLKIKVTFCYANMYIRQS